MVYDINTGMDFDTWSDIIRMFGHNVQRTPITKTTSNIEGDETLTSGTPEIIKVYITRKNAPWFLDKAGLILGGDALMLVTPGQTINKDDLISYDGYTYRVQDVISRDQIGGITAFKSVNLFKVS